MIVSRTGVRRWGELGLALVVCAGCGSTDSGSTAPAASASSSDVATATVPSPPARTFVPSSAMPSSLAAQSPEARVAPAPARPRDLGAELRSELGDVSDCFSGPQAGRAPTDVVVDVTVKPDGAVEVWRVAGEGLAAAAGACLRARATAIRLEAPVEGAPRVASAHLVFEAPAVAAVRPPAPPAPYDDASRLPSGFVRGTASPGMPISGPRGVPIAGPAGDPITGPAGAPITGPSGVPISGPTGDRIEGPSGVGVGDPSL